MANMKLLSPPTFGKEDTTLLKKRRNCRGYFWQFMEANAPHTYWRAVTADKSDGYVVSYEDPQACKNLQVLYISDHIYSDLNMSKKWVGWRTMLVVPELQTELVLQRKYSHVQVIHS